MLSATKLLAITLAGTVVGSVVSTSVIALVVRLQLLELLGDLRNLLEVLRSGPFGSTSRNSCNNRSFPLGFVESATVIVTARIRVQNEIPGIR